MLTMMDEVEKMVPSTGKNEEEVEEDEEEVEGLEGDDDAEASTEEEEDGDDKEQDVRDDEEKEDEAMPQAMEKNEKNAELPAKERKKDEGLNLNNEVVRMRKEVKRVRALIIRKLTRQTAALKRKKGKETEIERNQRRAARLLEEIHAMKILSPDLVTKTALQKNLNFEQTCKNPKSTITDRAIARIATHPQFNKKIATIKAAVKAFKEERMKAGKQGGKEKVQNKAGKVTPQSPDKNRERKGEKEEDDNAVEKTIIKDKEAGDDLLKDAKEAVVAEPIEEIGKAAHSADTAACQRKEMPESENVRTASTKCSDVKDIIKNKPQVKDAEKKSDLIAAPSVIPKKKDKDESDVESSDDEEKEYFDDSTEERFHKQSSESEESEDDDFFVGKVSKFKKKKKQKSAGEVNVRDVKTQPTDQVQEELDELESRLKSKGTSLQSVFCSSLAASKPGGGRGAGRGRGGDKFRGQGKSRDDSGLNRDFSKQSKFQKQEKRSGEIPGSKYSKPLSSEETSFGRGRGRGRGDATRQKDHRGRGAFSHQPPQQALHPSWEASKKRKEQQGQILAFQGKKIKFDDDD